MKQLVTAVVLAIAGAALLFQAHQTAAEIPSEADKDFGEFVRAAGGTLSSTPGFPDAFKQMHAERRMLQNSYIGGSGLVLLAAGAFGLIIPARRREV
ncbi:MAG: hypothetical protein ACREIT_01190 [Tepidisphaeraceae bacterium]